MRGCLLLLLSLLGTAPAFADVVVTKSGKVVRGKIVSEEEGVVVVRTLSGDVKVPRDRIQTLEDEASLLRLFDLQLKLIADTDADGFFRLSAWCADKGLYEKQEEVLSWVLAIDFDHEEARQALGYVRDSSGAWVKMDRAAERSELGSDFKKALRYYRDGKDDKALALLEEILGKQPALLEARYLLGEIHLSAGRFGQAGEAFRAMLGVDQRAPMAHYGLGHLHFREKNYPKAEAALKLAAETSEAIASPLEKKTLQAEIFFLLGSTYVAMGDKYYNEAEAEFLKSVALHRKHFRAWAELGILYGHKGVVKKAQDAFSKSLNANGRYAKARYNWGVLLYRQGELQQALIKLQPLVSSRKPYVPALLIAGRCFQRAGRNRDAKAFYEKYVKYGGDDPRGMEWLKEVE